MADDGEGDVRAAAPAAATIPRQKQKWIPLERDYAAEAAALGRRAALKPAPEHPLLAQTRGTKAGVAAASAMVVAAAAAAPAPGSTTSLGANVQPAASIGAAKEVLDPLRMLAAAQDEKTAPAIVDPLRAAFGGRTGDESKVESPLPLGGRVGGPSTAASSGAAAKAAAPAAADARFSSGDRVFEPWNSRKARVLQKYTTNAKIAVTASFLDESLRRDENKPVAVEQHIETRLELLQTDPKSEVAQNLLSQKEYVAHIEEQHNNLKTAWANGERVMSLKIAIQCAKLLGEPKVLQFYPSMYVLLSEILDTFGRLVFDRIKAKGGVIVDPVGSRTREVALPDNFRSADVSADAKETCRNWFYKTACIRELVPRIYVELTLLQCQRFLVDDAFQQIFARVCRSIRGIGDPLVACYTRAYLAHKYVEVARFMQPLPPDRNPLLMGFDDFLFTFRELNKRDFKTVSHIAQGRTSIDELLHLMAPALDWILGCIGYEVTNKEDVFFALMQQFKEYCNNAAILLHMVTHFSPRFLAASATNVALMIREAENSSLAPKSQLYLAFGRALLHTAPPKNQQLAVLNEVWKAVTKVQNLTEYCDVAVVFVEYVLKNLSDREVNIFLQDVIKHAKPNQGHLEVQEQLRVIIERVLSHTRDLERTLAMDNFLPLLDLLEKAAKTQVAKQILEALGRSEMTASDPVLLHTLFDVSRSLHDSIDSLSFSDERRQIAGLITVFVRRIDFGRDLEKQLNTYVECRQAFSNLDTVTQELVLRTALLATKAHRFMKGKHNKKTAAFVKACLAYCHITIASLEDVFARLRLFVNCGEVAIMNGMVVQGEAFFKAAVSLIPEVPPQVEVNLRARSTEDDLAQFLCCFASTLLAVPGHPQHGPFFLVKGLLNAIQQYAPWNGRATPAKARVYLAMLQLFCAYAQRAFPYHIIGVESNDRLYGGDEEYMGQIAVFVDTLVNELLAQLSDIGEAQDLASRKEQGTLALDLVNALVGFLEMNAHSATLVVKLFQLAQKSQAASTRYLNATLAHIQSKPGSWYADIAQKIVSLSGAADGAT